MSDQCKVCSKILNEDNAGEGGRCRECVGTHRYVPHGGGWIPAEHEDWHTGSRAILSLMRMIVKMRMRTTTMMTTIDPSAQTRSFSRQCP